MKRTLLILTALLGSAALAQTQSAAQNLFDDGKWQEATAAALAMNNATGYALAAEYTTAGAGLVAANQKNPLFSKAQEYARKAIALDPNNAEAYFELARAQGRLAQTKNPLEQLGLAKEMKANLDKAIKLNPKLAGAYVAVGLWNATLDAGGLKGAIAKSQTGANRSQVVPNFEKAIALEPDNITHRLEFANAYMLMGNKTAARAQAEKAVTMKADGYWGKLDLAAAQALLAKLK